MAKTEATKPEKYEPRVDMWGAITYSGPLTCETLTSQQRKKIINPKGHKRGVKVYKTLGKKISQDQTSSKNQTIEETPILCMDKGLAFKKEEVEEAIRDGGATNLHDVWIFPTNTAKFVSPLDNSLWHGLKDRVRARKPETEDSTARIMKREFMATQPTEIKNHYRHCGLIVSSDPYQGLMD